MTSVDTAHLIVAENATQEGSYVALTRAREQTQIHAERFEESPESAQIAQLAEYLGLKELDLPSIATPLAHERDIEVEHEREADTLGIGREHSPAGEQTVDQPVTPASRRDLGHNGWEM